MVIHSSPYWHPSDLEAKYYQCMKQSQILEGWEIQDKKDSTKTMNLFGTIADRVFSKVTELAKSTSRNAPEHKKGLPFTVNPIPTLDEIISDMSAGPSYRGDIKNIADEAFELIRTYINELRGTGKHVFMLDNQIINSNRFMFTYGMKATEIDRLIKDVQLDASSYICQEIVQRYSGRCLGVFHFNEEDERFLGSGAKEIDSQKISCFAYTLLKAREPQAKNFILTQKYDLKIKELQKWGYRIVSHPNENDLVLYMSDNNEEINHLGRFNEQGLVESKWGVNGKHIFEHSIFDVPANYGTHVIFMRKSSATL